jgi:hypothetical protein
LLCLTTCCPNDSAFRRTARNTSHLQSHDKIHTSNVLAAKLLRTSPAQSLLFPSPTHLMTIIYPFTILGNDCTAQNHFIAGYNLRPLGHRRTREYTGKTRHFSPGFGAASNSVFKAGTQEMTVQWTHTPAPVSKRNCGSRTQCQMQASRVAVDRALYTLHTSHFTLHSSHVYGSTVTIILLHTSTDCEL